MPEKFCPKCGTSKSFDDFPKNRSTKDGLSCYCKVCKSTSDKQNYERHKEAALARMKVYRETNAERLKAQKRLYGINNRASITAKRRAEREANPEKSQVYFKEYGQRPEVRERKRENSRRFREKPQTRAYRLRWLVKLKLEVFEHYGGAACRCCNEQEVLLLTLDHIFDDGAAHRREVGNKSMYLWAKQNGYPPIFEVMCFNCNCGRYHSGLGICPHEFTRQGLTGITPGSDRPPSG